MTTTTLADPGSGTAAASAPSEPSPGPVPQTPPVAVHRSVVATPAGPLVVVSGPDGVVHAAGFGEPAALLQRWSAASGRPVEELEPVGAADLAPGLAAALERYTAGDAGALDAVPVHQPGGVFHQAAWVAMRTVTPGRTVTYTALAERAGRPLAVRAAASACARNLIAPFVPCHRIVRTDGSLGGYAYGLDVKRALLAHERAATGG